MTRYDEERLVRASLSMIGEPGDLRLTHLVNELGAGRVWEGLVRQGETDELREDLAARIEALDAATLLQDAARQGIRFLIPGDDEWPVRVEDLAFAPALHDRGGIPIGLWIRGRRHLAEAVAQSVSIVGSRSATTYGTEVTRRLSIELADAGYASVSGAAYGIDQAAHRGSLMAGAPTVALLSCGVDRAYPTAHKELLDWICENGVVVSESPPGGSPTRIRFLSRNRLIAAVGCGVVVVEAALRSGALNTANWGIGLGREVMGVPGPVTSAPSSGVHQLIRVKGANLVTSAAEVLEVVGRMGQHLLEFPREASQPRDLLTSQQRQVLDAVPVQEAVNSERISRAAGLSRRRT
ncbi:MAG TPA: DNA-processing protein DprA, partial [Marmoricola sp.]|nr:DNA-processing protein DprA [Marmoricola sp.]